VTGARAEARSLVVRLITAKTIGPRIVERPIGTLLSMTAPIDRDQLERFWLRLRREAHELYREAGTLRGRVRELERSLSSSEHSLAVQRQENEKLKVSLDGARTRLRMIEGSRAWKAVRFVRRMRRVIGAGRTIEPSGPTLRTPPPPLPKPPVREPTFAQRWAAEAARRAAAAEQLDLWLEESRRAPAAFVVIAAGDPSDEHTRSFVEQCIQRGEPVCELEADGLSARIHGVVPPGIQPSLVPDVLRMGFSAKEKVFICTSPGHAAIRWLVPAQQDGWSTAVVLGDVVPSATLTYLSTHADAVFVRTEEAARLLEAATGVRPLVRDPVLPGDVVEARRSLAPAIPRQILGID